ncbi:MAG: aminodeoxychorismate/anthranilate synthase component II [Gammaproteobacteria bacterium]|nr:aminodeoxychorismate/anthranilate synthase component II [Gammaproteobacteria bacterium]MDE0246734.1 aminodeoxychorismate/anthranilate synthase component II [Gammaproteobacteria bacterium]
MLLVIDNYDSFTFNLVQFLGELGAEPTVVRNDEASVPELEAMQPSRVVISPGPCTPQDAGVSIGAVCRLGEKVPLLGVCLGHQAIGEAFGGRTIRAARVMHGKTTEIRHTGEGIFRGLAMPLEVTRYHSLVTDPAALPAVLEPVAWSPGGGENEEEIQAVRHRELPIWGVQFHPESIFSRGGMQLLENFLEL